MKRALCGLLLWCVGGSLPAFAAQAACSAEIQANDVLEIVTLNLYHDKDDWPKRRVQIAEKLKVLRPDAIALQEVLQHETLPNQAQWLAEQLGYAWFFISTDPPGQVHRYGNALLTRHPILARQQLALHPLDDSRTAGLLRIDLQGRPMNLYVTHLHWTDGGGAIRARQLVDLKQFIADTAGGFPSVVAGDFNASVDAPELAGIQEGFVDAYGSQHAGADDVSSSTLNLKYFAPKRIDHVFFQRDAFQAVSSEIIFNRPDAQGVWASDHFGLHVILKLRKDQGEAKTDRR